ncbi:hypothetical protein BC835DRAFT_1386699 [Cytidiella melzeri]|nr:hypothetical protein BC835DRAFT_1386699 [Cytidiella melzeri]
MCYIGKFKVKSMGFECQKGMGYGLWGSYGFLVNFGREPTRWIEKSMGYGDYGL